MKFLATFNPHSGWNSIAHRLLLGVLTVYGLLPLLAQGQTAATVSLDGSGNLVLSATLEYEEFLTLEIFENIYEEGYWDIPVDTSAHQWVYYDLRNSNYNNGFTSPSGPSRLIEIFDYNPKSDSLEVNSDFLKDLFYLGEYTFGDTDYDYPVPAGIPDIKLTGKNAYYAGKATNAIDHHDNGTLSIRVVLPFDPTTSSELSPVEFHLKDDAGEILDQLSESGHTRHQSEYGQLTGGWVSSPSGCSTGDTIEDCGLIGGDYEFVVFIESHAKLGPEAISAFQNKIPYVRFTIVDEDSATAPSVTILDTTSYVGEANLATGNTFTISNSLSSNPHVDFIVGNGHGITLNANFKAELGTSFKTILGGGYALSKGGDQYIFPKEDAYVTEPAGTATERVSVYPNPGSGVMWAELSTDSPQSVILTIYDLLGRTIQNGVSLQVSPGRTKVNIFELFDMAALVNGSYMLHVDADEYRESILFTYLR